MAKNSRLNTAAQKIGSVMGKADAKAHKVAKAGHVAKQELVELTKQVNALAQQLKKSSKRLQRALK